MDPSIGKASTRSSNLINLNLNSEQDKQQPEADGQLGIEQVHVERWLAAHLISILYKQHNI